MLKTLWCCFQSHLALMLPFLCRTERDLGPLDLIANAGVKVTDKDMLEWGNINPQEVAKIVSEAFNEMIFNFG